MFHSNSTLAFAALETRDLPEPDKVLPGPVPKELRLLFQEARIHTDRYWQKLAEVYADQHNIKASPNVRCPNKRS